MDILAKVTLVAAVIMMGYNLHQMLITYEASCEKAKEFKSLAAESESDEASVQRTNIVLSGGLSIVFVVLAYFSGFAYWVLGAICVKMAFTMVLSHVEITKIFKNNQVELSFFRLMKADSFLNVLIGLAVALILVV